MCVPCCCEGLYTCICKEMSNVMCTLCGDENESDVYKKINDAHSGDVTKCDTPSGDKGDARETDPLIKKRKW